MTLSATLEAALIGQATKQDVIEAIDAELARMDEEEIETARESYFAAGQPF